MKDPKIVLSLSGGGVRATAFHLGVLKFLAEQQAFKKIKANQFFQRSLTGVSQKEVEWHFIFSHHLKNMWLKTSSE
tara:strand:+ start:1508 stop:1735 length:228 start_codon:yes stop_codon:yes gene_type:complete